MRHFYLFMAFLLCPIFLYAQALTGKVMNAETGAPVIGANVFFSNTQQGTITGNQGDFSLEKVSGADSVTISHVGYQTKVVAITNNLLVELKPVIDLEEVLIKGVRAKKNVPVAHSTISKQELESVYNGEQPVFFLADMTPSIFSYSESGAHIVNYGSMRLRGINQERINFTLNGVPLNDMIDHGVFFSNFTDIAGSFESVQVQRGVGTSSNGVASYAGSINFESVNIQDRERGAKVELGAGSFNTYRMNGSVSSGMIDDKWSFYGSYSKVLSDGYRYNTSTDAYSFFFSGGYFGEKDMIKINAFDANSKNELGYLVVPQETLKDDPRTNLNNENDKDNFGQRFVQLQHSHIFNERFSTNASLYYGGASGDFFYAWENEDATVSKINYPLYNDHYGAIFNVFGKVYDDLDASTGIHGYVFNRVNDEAFAPDLANPYYHETSSKKEVSWFGKLEYHPGAFNIYADMQIRQAQLDIQPDYGFIGIEPEGDITKDWFFANPKAGISYTFPSNLTAYASYGRMGREPTKVDIFGGFGIYDTILYQNASSNDFKPEYVNDFEAGMRWNAGNFTVNANGFYMQFENEIAAIGELLPFGAQKRKNIENSYRLGLETEWSYTPFSFVTWYGNTMVMKSEIELFYDASDSTTYNNVTPVLSPEGILNSGIEIRPLENLTFNFSGKYVSNSFLELTNNPKMILPEYYVADASVAYTYDKISWRLEVNNLFNEQYFMHGAPTYAGTPGYLVSSGINYFLTMTIDI